MPAESVLAAPFGSRGDVGTSRLEEQLEGKTTRSHAHSKEALFGLGRGTFGRNSWGSFLTELGYPRHVRFTAGRDRGADIPVRQLRAMNRPEAISHL